MRTRHESLKGRGRLVSRLSGAAHSVVYRFDIIYRIADGPERTSPAKKPVESQFEARGSVKTVDGPTLKNEHYDLQTAEATYHVWRDEERWHIDALPADSESARVVDGTTVL